jgi:hypothetical protein
MYDFEHEHFFGREARAPRSHPEFFIDARGRAHRREPQLTWGEILVGWAPTLVVHGLMFLAFLPAFFFPGRPTYFFRAPGTVEIFLFSAYLLLGPLSLLFTAAMSVAQFPRTRTPNQTLVSILGVTVGAFGLMKLLPAWLAFLGASSFRW